MSEISQEHAQQRVWQQMKPASILGLKGAALVFSGEILEVLSETHLERGAYPEPFDVASHIGNFREASIVTMAAGAVIATMTIPNEVVARNKSDKRIVKRARLAAIGAFVGSSAVQVVGEAFGLTNSVVEANTPDMLDAAYGIGWSAVIAAAAYRIGMKFMRSRNIIDDNQAMVTE